jgi:hypothetical protein
MTIYTVNTLHKWADKLAIKVELLTQSLAMSALEGVTMKSPTDTGRFKNSWQIAAGKPNLAVLPKGNYGSDFTMPDPPQVKDPYTKLFVTNNLDYGPALEDGHSGFAPDGMVKLTMLEVRVHIKSAARKLKNDEL